MRRPTGKKPEISALNLGRRQFLRLAAAAILPLSLKAASGRRFGFGEAEKELAFINLHTGESFEAVYWRPDGFSADSLEGINRVLRDPFTGEIKAIDLGLLDALHRLTLSVGASAPFHVISGYRSPETNARLRREGRGVAENSLHLAGRAIDVRLPGCPLSRLRDAALALKAGGVGYYPASDFIHLDTGRVRAW